MRRAGYLPPGTTDDRLLSAIDLSATTLAIAGAQKPDWMQGRILFGKQTEPEREYVFCASLADWQRRTKDCGMEPDSEAIIKAFDDYRAEGHASRADKINALEKAIRDEITRSSSR